MFVGKGGWLWAYNCLIKRGRSIVFCIITTLPKLYSMTSVKLWPIFWIPIFLSSVKKERFWAPAQCKGTDELQELIVDDIGGFIDPLLNERLLGILSTKENVNLETLGFETNINNYSAGHRSGSISRKRDSARCLSTATRILTISMISFCVSTVRPWSDLKWCVLFLKKTKMRNAISRM